MTTLKSVRYAIVLLCLTIPLLHLPIFANKIDNNTSTNSYSLDCNGQINVSLSTFGFSIITPSMLVSNTSSVGPLEVQIMDSNNNNIGNVVNCAYVGQILMVLVTDTDSGNSCWGSILVEDKYAPTITCSNITIACSDDTTPVNTGTPAVSDNCGITTTPTYTDEIIESDCNDPQFVAVINRTWTVTDLYGNSNSCVQNISISKADINTTVFPTNVVLDCTNPNLDPLSTGEPMINGNTIGGYCGLMFFHTDADTFHTCGGGYKFLREWLVIDWCTNEIITHNQLFEIADTTPPIIECPDTLIFNTTANSCLGNVFLTIPTVTDDCSNNTITVDFYFQQSTDQYTYLNIPAGTHSGTYTATDECGNSSSCTFYVTVKDMVAPIPVCEGTTQVALGSDGFAKVDAIVFDKASTDNCEIDTFLVRRMDEVDFSGCAEFSCNDIGDTIMVVLRVIDFCGNYNECMVEAIVEDKIPPTLVCPPDKTVDCSELATLDIDTPSFLDNCGLAGPPIMLDDETIGFDNCNNTGTIIRRWYIEDLSGLRDTCTQIITVEDNEVLSFTFPNDTTISCTSSFDPSVTGTPIVSSGCGDILIVPEDENLFPVNPPCEILLVRRWRLFDNCTNTFLPQEGTQLINIVDDVAPVVTCQDTIKADFFGFDAPCETFVNVFTDADDACSFISNIFNNDPLGTSPFGFNASGSYPIGETTVIFTAEDACGNVGTCETVVQINDRAGPFILCPPFITLVAPTPTTPVSITVDEIEGMLNTFDMCTPDSITFFIDPSSINQPSWICADAVNANGAIDTITVFAQDISGNVSSNCEVEVRIACPLLLTMAGVIYTPESEMVKDVMVKINDGSDSTMNYAEEGEYFQDSLTIGNDYIVTPEKNINPLNGVTTFDLVLIRKHILGLELLDNPYKIIAADANQSNSVTALDIVLLRSLILHIIDELPNSNSWRFVDAHHQFTNTINPFLDTFSESMSCINVTQNDMNMNFVGIKVGDVNATATSENLITIDTRTPNSSIQFYTEDILLEKSKTYSVPIFADNLNELEGFQFTLDFDFAQIEFLEIENGILFQENFGRKYEKNGAITCSWIRENEIENLAKNPLFSIIIKAKNKIFLEDILSINSRYIVAEAYNIKNKIHGIDLLFEKNDLNLYNQLNEVLLFQNQPNPFTHTTKVKFYLPHHTYLELHILDITGKIVKKYQTSKSKGIHYLDVEGSILPSSGVYFYKLITPTFSSSKKMLIIK